MTKDDLIFEWHKRDIHAARQIVPFILVLAAFGFCFSIFEFGFEVPRDISIKSASVTYLLDDDIGRRWQLVAEEDGPFPGRLDIDDQSGLLNSGTILGQQGEELWSKHRIELKTLPEEDVGIKDRIAAKGVRYFPSHGKSATEVPGEVELVEGLELYPSLIPFEEQSVKWIPESLPPFPVKIEEGTLTSAWRFVLNLRPDGTVAQCFSLSGGREKSLDEMARYLEGLKFQAADEESRWIGLRVEFLNRKKNESDPE